MLFDRLDEHHSSFHEHSDNIPRYKKGEPVRACGNCESGQRCYQYDYDTYGNLTAHVECDECGEVSHVIPIRVAK